MRKQIAAANWKMNLGIQQGEKLLQDILSAGIELQSDRMALFAVPFPYMQMAQGAIKGRNNYFIAAQNCYQQKEGAFTGEVSASMLHSMQIGYCIIGHSERREYFQESGKILAEKLDRCLENSIIPVFCCGEPLPVREAGNQDSFVENQLRESLFHLSKDQINNIIIAYEPIWAIGTGRTATTAQAQEMHAHIRSILARQFGKETADQIPVLYGGSVKAGNAAELFACPDLDGGLVGGASLVAGDFTAIIKALK